MRTRRISDKIASGGKLGLPGSFFDFSPIAFQQVEQRVKLDPGAAAQRNFVAMNAAFEPDVYRLSARQP